MRWVLWFLLVPQLYLLQGWVGSTGQPLFDATVLLCVFLAWFARPACLPVLLLGVAAGRALVDDAGLAVQMLVVGTPTALVVPLRSIVFRRNWLWQGALAAVVAIVVPRLSGLLGAWFSQPSASAELHGANVLWSALLVPPLLAVFRRLPPLRGFEEDLS
ncbi:MAG: hypothetical protein RL148_1583 [Planctomycetota bacterium]|jgi:hypothetical protein